jgi:(p)ppGpp synthase/HD superfamily hydrolase
MTLLFYESEKDFAETASLGPRLQRAFRYAAEKHAGQTRKQTAVPYLAHLMAVAALVLEAGGDEEMAIAALLHDVVEDCGGMPRLREVRKQFGREWRRSWRAARIRSASRSRSGWSGRKIICAK